MASPQAHTQTSPDAIAVHNQAPVGFLSLPSELRNEVYEYLLGGYSFYTAGRNKTEDKCVQPAFKNFLAITAVNHEIRSETALLPFSLNSFGGPFVELSSTERPMDDTFFDMLWCMTNDQRSVIKTIHLQAQSMDHIGRILREGKADERFVGSEPSSLTQDPMRYQLARQDAGMHFWENNSEKNVKTYKQRLEAEMHTMLKKLVGLRGVVIVTDVERLTPETWESIVVGVQHCTGRKDLDIVFDNKVVRSLQEAQTLNGV